MPEIIYNIASLTDFKRLLVENPGRLILEFSAEWCIPCGKIKDTVKERFEAMPEHVQCVIVDVDESFEVYAYMKNKKMVGGIPTMLMYKKGNVELTYDDSVNGINMNDIHAFFDRCLSPT